MNQKILNGLCIKLLGVMFMAVSGALFGAGNVVNKSAVSLSSSEVEESKLIKDPAKQLESLVVEVNGERRIVDPKVGIEVVSGDLFTIVEAYLVDKAAAVKTVDLIGFRSRVTGHSHDDRGRVIDTGRNLSKKRSLSGDGAKYRIEAFGPEGLYGVTVLNIREPELLSFDVEINGKLEKILPGQSLKLRSSDTIRIVDVRTNVRGNENVKYDAKVGRRSKEIRFSRGDKIFARISIDWQGP